MPWAELTDVRCYYELLGNGEPLLLIPGWGTTCDHWGKITSHLSKSLSLILIDNRGVGRSVARRLPQTLADYAADIVELFDELQLDRAHVLGLSLGGLIAQRLAVDHPSRVDRLVLVSCTDRFTPYLGQMAAMLGRSARWMPRQAFQRTFELLGTGPQYVDAHAAELEERVQQRCARSIGGSALVQQLRCLARSELPEAEYRIQSPTMVIAGEHDAIIPSCYGRRMAEKIPGSRFLLVSGAGHNPMDEYPDTVLPEIVNFLGNQQHSQGMSRTRPSFGEVIVPT